jgi:hypothetical protein
VNGGQFRSKWRRGAPVPAASIRAPSHLNAAQRRAFDEALRSRPGFFTESDVRLLSAYAIAAAAVEELERHPERAETPTSYRRAVDTMLRFSKALRLAPSARANNDDAVPPPPPLAPGDDSAGAWQHAARDADPATPAPWVNAARHDA